MNNKRLQSLESNLVFQNFKETLHKETMNSKSSSPFPTKSQEVALRVKPSVFPRPLLRRWLQQSQAQGPRQRAAQGVRSLGLVGDGHHIEGSLSHVLPRALFGVFPKDQESLAKRLNLIDVGGMEKRTKETQSATMCLVLLLQFGSRLECQKERLTTQNSNWGPKKGYLKHPKTPQKLSKVKWRPN